MNLNFLIFCALVPVLFNQCTHSNHQAFVHVRAEGKTVGKRQLMVFMDGTGNDIGTRTNVRNLYEMTTSKQRPEVLTFYDPGVGVGGSLFNRAMGNFAGYGFRTNLKEALVFLTENYQAGDPNRAADEIAIFGFSRGAYSAGVLATMISRTGLPAFEQKEGEALKDRHKRASRAVDVYFSEAELTLKDASKTAYSACNCKTPPNPSQEAAKWRDKYWETLSANPAWSDLKKGQKVAVLGLWDPVASLLFDYRSFGGAYRAILGTAFTNGRNAEFDRHRGDAFYPFAMNSNIQECYIAYSLDERRQSFTAEVPEQRPRKADGNPGNPDGMPGIYEFVWFPGDHSDNGGGWLNDKDIAGLSMNWLLSKVGTKLLGTRGDEYRVYENATSPRHDNFSSKLYSMGGFRIRGELFPSSRTIPITKPNEYAMRPTSKDLWTMKVHSSVLKRMEAGGDLFVDPNNHSTFDLTQETGPQHFDSQYYPHPFRAAAAAKNAKTGWIDKKWSSEDIRQNYPERIVKDAEPQPATAAKDYPNAPVVPAAPVDAARR